MTRQLYAKVNEIHDSRAVAHNLDARAFEPNLGERVLVQRRKVGRFWLNLSESELDQVFSRRAATREELRVLVVRGPVLFVQQAKISQVAFKSETILCERKS